MPGAVLEMLVPAEPSLDLGTTKVRIALNKEPRGVEESGYFRACHLIVNLKNRMFMVQTVKLELAVSSATHPEKALTIGEKFIGWRLS